MYCAPVAFMVEWKHLGEQFFWTVSMLPNHNTIIAIKPLLLLDFRPAVRLDNGSEKQKERFAMSRINEYKTKWVALIAMYGSLCYYCQKEIATSIDHVVPYSYDQMSEIENLVPACTLCNCLASNKHFETIEQKRQYILGKRKSRANAIAICTECLLPFSYRIHSPSLFLCAECYDEEYFTNYRSRKAWKTWIKEMWEAGIPAEAHRITKKVELKGHKKKMEYLAEQYLLIADSDDSFAEKLIYS